MGVNYSPKTVSDGLVFFVDAGNYKSYPGSGVPVYELSGNNNTGSLIASPAWSTGSFGFNGTNQYIDFGSQPAFTNLVSGSAANMTICTWINPNAGVGSLIVAKGDNNISSGWFFGNNSSLQLVFSNICTGTNGRFSSTTSITSNIWQFVTVTYAFSAIQCKFYNNGVESTITTTNTPTNDPTSDAANSLWIGQSVFSDTVGTTLANGQIAQVSLYNRVLSAQEVLQNFNATRGRFGV